MDQPRRRRRRQQGLSTGVLVSIIAVSVIFAAGAITGVILLVKSRGGHRAPMADVVPASGIGTKIGQLTQEIEGEDLDGKRFKLSDYRGKVVVLDFWGNW